MDKQKIDLLIFIEHVARELDISAALKSLLTRRYGLSVEIASIVAKHGRREALQKYAPRVAAVPYFYSTTDPGPMDILLSCPDILCVNLAYEQIFSKINTVFKAPKDEYARKFVLHHAWGEFFAKYLRDYGVQSQNIFVNGNPTFALYQPPYSSFFPTKSELAQRYSLDAEKRWVLIPENYGAAFYGDKLIKNYLHYGLQDAVAYRNFALASFREAAGWWKQGAVLDEVELIVRPRPAVPTDIFIRTCQEQVGEIPERMHIIKDGTVREWILASDIVMSSYSTTLIEAAVARKPIYMIEPIQFPDYIQADWYPFVPRLKTLQEYLAVIADTGVNRTYQALESWAAQSMLTSPDVIGSLANWLAAVCKGETHLPGKPDAASLPQKPQPETAYSKLLRAAKNPGRAARSIVNKIKGREAVLETIVGHEKDSFSQADIEIREKRWEKVLG
jgi:surface carbohydrate biosynthesis protein